MNPNRLQSSGLEHEIELPISDANPGSTMKKPFDVLAEGLDLSKSRGEKIRTSDLLVPNQALASQKRHSGHKNGDSDAASIARCTNRCTENPADPIGSPLTDLLRMIERLPLSDAEKAEAVRRLMAEAVPHG
ncbi:MAG: hypothetical protein DCC66_13445 [Planctomycetota bacterium]|nr:MAG: hypothetical protein DCC66_13445 [Planctomycetota bacterium]